MKKYMPNIYLAGSFYGFRDKIIDELPYFHFIDPRKNRQNSISSLIEDDMKGSIKASVFLACFPKGKTRGTATYSEIGASKANGNYVIIADENKEKDPLLERFADMNHQDIDDAIEFLRFNNYYDLKSKTKKIPKEKNMDKAENIFFAGDFSLLTGLQDLNKKIIKYEDLNELGDFKDVDLTLTYFPKKGEWNRKQIFFMGVSYALNKPIILLDEKEIPYPPLYGLARRVFRNKYPLIDYLTRLKSQKIDDEAKIMYDLFKKYNNII